MGDPHFGTSDGLRYTFNGLGEYWLLKSSSTEIQVRTDRAWNSTNQPSITGTVFSGVVGRAWYKESNVTVSSAVVHVEMPADRTSGTSSPTQLPILRSSQLRCYLRPYKITFTRGTFKLLFAIFFQHFLDVAGVSRLVR